MKKIVIFKGNGGRLANQLWNYASIYSWCLEEGFECENYSFFRYQKYFGFKIKSKFYNLFLDVHQWHGNYKLSTLLYHFFYLYALVFCGKRVVKDNNVEFFLPPTKNSNPIQSKMIDSIQKSKDATFYLAGWVFRNPDGFKKYKAEIKQYFTPKDMYISKIKKLKLELREQYNFIVGVHMRQGDYKTWQNGRFFYNCHDVAKILRNFLNTQSRYTAKETVFVLCSDGPIEKNEFSGLNIALGPGSEITDLYMLAESDLIIGSSSTFGGWAAFYGSIPFIQFSREKIDWSRPTTFLY